MAKAPGKPVNIKDLPPPKGFRIIGGSSKRTESKDDKKTSSTNPRLVE
jgi:hypothetical protein